jgi:hypothetical protein
VYLEHGVTNKGFTMQASRYSLTVFLLIVTTLIGSLVGQQAPTVASSAPMVQQ